MARQPPLDTSLANGSDVTTHPELLQCLVVLNVARLLVLAAAPAPVSSYAGYRRTGSASGLGPANRVATGCPARVRAPRAEPVRVPTTPDVTTPPAAGPVTDPNRGAVSRPLQRGARSRRRGSRDGRIWRTAPQQGQLALHRGVECAELKGSEPPFNDFPFYFS